MTATDAAAQADTPEVLAAEDKPFFNSTPDRTPAPAIYDRNGEPLSAGDRVYIRYEAEDGRTGETVTARLCLEEVFVLQYDRPTSWGGVSRMIRHRPQVELMELKAEKVK